MASLAWSGSTAVRAEGVRQVTASATELVVSGDCPSPGLDLIELEPFEADSVAPAKPALVRPAPGALFQARLPRYVDGRDRLYSGFVLRPDRGTSEPALTGDRRFVDDFSGVSGNRDPYPAVASKKGLQVQMVDDAIALGVKHAALNVNLSQMPDLKGRGGATSWAIDGRTLSFDTGFLEHLDRQIKPLSDAGVVVSLILLAYESGDAAVDRVMLHPRYDRSAPNKLALFNTTDADGVRWLKACVEVLAERYSRADRSRGRVANYIVGNEVNSHWYWANRGPVSLEEFTVDYLRAVRICHAAVRKFSAGARIHISLEHHWEMAFDRDPLKGFAGRPFLERFAALARAGGDFDWHLAYHPYPENLFECRFWNDRTALWSATTPRITFKNLEVLTEYLRRPGLLHQGHPRRVILSEQGFHSPDTAEGEEAQAAAYALAFYKVARMEGVDSFILHRHVDHGHEGGLNLGLWARRRESPNPAEPLRRKRIYEVFRTIDTEQGEAGASFALRVAGWTNWQQAAPRPVDLRGAP